MMPTPGCAPRHRGKKKYNYGAYNGELRDQVASMSKTRAYQTCRALMQPAPLLGALTIAAFWIGLAYLLSVERTKAIDAAIQEGGRIVRLIDDHAAQLIGTMDRTLLLLRQAYEEKPAQFNLHQWTERASVISGMTTDVGLIDANAYMYT